MTRVPDTSKAETFKAKGAEILKPKSMEGFIKDSQITQMHKTANPQNHILCEKNTDRTLHEKIPETYKKSGRLHIQIRQDLIDRLLETVFKRKRDPKTANRAASQRAIVEEALERYFKNHEGENESYSQVDKAPV